MKICFNIKQKWGIAMRKKQSLRIVSSILAASMAISWMPVGAAAAVPDMDTAELLQATSLSEENTAEESETPKITAASLEEHASEILAGTYAESVSDIDKTDNSGWKYEPASEENEKGTLEIYFATADFSDAAVVKCAVNNKGGTILGGVFEGDVTCSAEYYNHNDK